MAGLGLHIQVLAGACQWHGEGGFVASYRPSRGSLRFAIWRQVGEMTTKTCNSPSYTFFYA